jgi:multidrug efflux pump subunit AcrB
MDALSAKVLPKGFTTALAGQSRDYAESSSSLIFAFIFAIVLIYLVLAAQFESLIDPFIILLTVPMALDRSFAQFVGHQSVDQHFQSDRDHHADRSDHQERNSDRGICQSTQRRRTIG